MKLRDGYQALEIKGRRTIVISDIHGEKQLFERLLEQTKFSHDDYLIIGGDILDKGQNSIETMEYVFQLLEQPNVFMIKGNCDRIFEELDEDWLYDYMTVRRTIVHDYLALNGKAWEDYSQHELAEEMRQTYQLYREKLQQLPLAIETEDYLFIHAGIENREDYLETDEESALMMPNFYLQHHPLDKYVVVGHYPAANYIEDGLYSHEVKVSEERKIIAIDGGNQVKPSGQLNALIIEKDGTLSTEKVDNLPETLVIQSFEVSYQEPHSFAYPAFDIDVGEGDEYFTAAVHQETQQSFMVKTEYIIRDAAGHHRLIDDYTDLFLDVEAGEIVKVVDRSLTGYTLIKKTAL